MNNRFYLKFLNVKTLGFILFACGLGLVVWFTYLMIVMPFLKDIEQFVDFTIYKELAILYLILSSYLLLSGYGIAFKKKIGWILIQSLLSIFLIFTIYICSLVRIINVVENIFIIIILIILLFSIISLRKKKIMEYFNITQMNPLVRVISIFLFIALFFGVYFILF